MKLLVTIFTLFCSLSSLANSPFGGNGFVLMEFKVDPAESEYVFSKKQNCLGVDKYVYAYFDGWNPEKLEELLNPELKKNTEWVKLEKNRCEYGAQGMTGNCKLFHNRNKSTVTIFMCATE